MNYPRAFLLKGGLLLLSALVMGGCVRNYAGVEEGTAQAQLTMESVNLPDFIGQYEVGFYNTDICNLPHQVVGGRMHVITRENTEPAAVAVPSGKPFPLYVVRDEPNNRCDFHVSFTPQEGEQYRVILNRQINKSCSLDIVAVSSGEKIAPEQWGQLCKE